MAKRKMTRGYWLVFAYGILSCFPYLVITFVLGFIDMIMDTRLESRVERANYRIWLFLRKL